MSDFTDFLIERGIIAILMKNYGINLKVNEVNNFILKMVEKLSAIDYKDINQKEQGDDRSFDLDIIAKFYEDIIPHSQRKTMGEFYTPIQIVDYILESVNYTSQQDIDNKKLIDLSCGSGSFLIRAAKILSEKLRKQAELKENSELNYEQAKNIINRIKVNIFGVDINPIACILCQINLYFTLFDLLNLILENDNEYKIPIFKILNKNALQLKFSNKYDYVVGNPPYLFIRSIPQDFRKLIANLPLETNKGQYDYYQIFIEIGIKNLKNGGLLGYIIPDSLLALSNRKILRRFIYNSTKIREIYYSGPQFDEPVVSNIILTLEKESDVIKRNNNQIKIKFPLNQSQADNIIPQNLIEYWDYQFLINLNEKDIRILDNLNENFPKLGELIEGSKFNINLSRGVELGKEGKVIFCDKCNKYYPLPNNGFNCLECMSILKKNSIEKIVVEEIPDGLESDFWPFIYSMNRYAVNEIKYIDITKKGINYKKLEIYQNRIVIRQLSQNSLICATYDEDSVTSQSFYNLKIYNSSVPEFNNKYVLGLLNSRLLSYFFIKSFGSYKKLFPRILIEKLKKLPLKVPKTTDEKKLAQRLTGIINKILTSMSSNKYSIINLQRVLDSLVFELYQIGDNDRNYIKNYTDFLRNK